MVLKNVVHKRFIGFGLRIVIFLAALVILLPLWDPLFAWAFQMTPAALQPIEQFLERLFQVLLVLVCTQVFLVFSEGIISEHFAETKRPRDIQLVLSLYRWTVWLLVGLALAATIFHGLGPLIGSLGLIGAALTLALQKPILNFVGWLVIIFNRPFSVGDYIQIDSKDGEVIDIQIMFTSVKMFGNDAERIWGKTVMIPNELVLANTVNNLTRVSDWLSEEVRIGVTFESNWKKALLDLQEIAESVVSENVFDLRPQNNLRSDSLFTVFKNGLKPKTPPAPAVHSPHFNEIKKTTATIEIQDSWILLKVRFVTNDREPTRRFMRSAIQERFLEKAANNGAYQIAYPHIELIRK